MKHLHVDRHFAWLAFCLSFLSLLAWYGLFLVFGVADITGENGPMENLQLLMIAAAMLVFLLFSLRSVGADQVVGVGMAVLSFGFFFREIDLRRIYGVDSWQAMIHDRSLRNILLPFLLFGAAIYLYRNRAYAADVLSYSFSPRSWPLVLVGILLICGMLSEEIYKDLWPDPHWVFLEQGFQWAAYLLLLLAAVWFLRNARRSA